MLKRLEQGREVATSCDRGADAPRSAHLQTPLTTERARGHIAYVVHMSTDLSHVPSPGLPLR